MPFKRSFILLFLSFVCLSTNAQKVTDNISESVVSNEEKFANALREMYIGKFDKAISLFEAMYKEDRTNASVAFELVKAYKEKKDFLMIEKYAKVVLENASSNTFMLEYLAKIFMENNKPGTSQDIYSKLLAIKPKELKYYDELANALVKQEKYTDAIQLYKNYENLMGKSSSVSLKKFELYDLANKTNDALTEINALTSQNSNDKKYHKIKANYLLKLGKNQEALEAFKKVLLLDPEDTEANLILLSKGTNNEKPNAYLMSLIPIITNQSIPVDKKVQELIPYVEKLSNGGNQDVKQSLKELGNKLILTHPDEAKAYSIYGDILMSSGNTDEAVTQYEKTISLNNKNFIVWEQLMYGYIELENYSSLLTTSNKALDLYPNQAINYFFNAIANIKNQNNKEAISIAQEGLMVSGGNKIIQSKLKTSIALAHLLNNEKDKATNIIDEAIALNDKNAFAYEVLGDIYESKGDSNKAKEFWKKSITLGNKSKKLLNKVM